MFYIKLLLPLFLPLLLMSSTHENAEDKKVSRWKVLRDSSAIQNIYDEKKSSYIITFQGKGTHSAYRLNVNAAKKKEYWLSWQMKFSEDFIIIVVIETNKGEQFLVYTPGAFKSYKQYGIGLDATNGKWQTYRRNLQTDLAYFDNRIEVLSLKQFVIRGTGSIDNISTLEKISKEKVFKKESVKQQIIKKEPLLKYEKHTNTVPTIEIKGESLVKLDINELYVEAGFFAHDEEDGQISVQSIDNIDSSKNGRYTIMYMARDSDGNVAMKQRVIHVGEVEEEKEEQEEILDIEEKDKEEKVDLEEEQYQIEVWERELELREKELLQREKNSNKSEKIN